MDLRGKGIHWTLSQSQFVYGGCSGAAQTQFKAGLRAVQQQTVRCLYWDAVPPTPGIHAVPPTPGIHILPFSWYQSRIHEVSFVSHLVMFAPCFLLM